MASPAPHMRLPHGRDGNKFLHDEADSTDGDTMPQKRVVMTKMEAAYKGTVIAAKTNPAFTAEGGSDTIFVCPNCSAKLGEYQPYTKMEVPVKCADCGTISKVPNTFWKSVGAP